MSGEFFQVPSSDGDAFDAYLSLPAGGRGPGVVMIPEIFGVNDGLRQCADLFAGQGYAVLAPDIFWRLERNVQLDYGEASYKKAFALHHAFDYEQGVADMNDAIEWLRSQSFCTENICVTGFCLGGTMAYLAAARCDIDAAAGYYGTRIQNFLDDAAKINRPLLQHFGAKDHTTPPEFRGPILDAVAGNANVTSFIYETAGHAFANPGRPETYMESIAALAHGRTFELFARVTGMAGGGAA
ncbi:MAG: dienelactone hydrolase family protein [Proteobacteria bacterium]|nr:dienelactone hydrolase family protein [Pseudomonadota bacterium]